MTKDWFFSYLWSCQLNIPSVLTSVTSKESLALGAEGYVCGAKQRKYYLIRCIFQLVLVICQGTPQSLKDKSEAWRFIFVLVNAWRKIQNQNKALRVQQREKTSSTASEIFKWVMLLWQYRMLNNHCVFSKGYWCVYSLMPNKARKNACSVVVVHHMEKNVLLAHVETYLQFYFKGV